MMLTLKIESTMAAMIEGLIRRKQTRLGDDHRLVREYSLVQNDGE
jgi:hypothetical protein